MSLGGLHSRQDMCLHDQEVTNTVSTYNMLVVNSNTVIIKGFGASNSLHISVLTEDISGLRSALNDGSMAS